MGDHNAGFRDFSPPRIYFCIHSNNFPLVGNKHISHEHKCKESPTDADLPSKNKLCQVGKAHAYKEKWSPCKPRSDTEDVK